MSEPAKDPGDATAGHFRRLEEQLREIEFREIAFSPGPESPSMDPAKDRAHADHFVIGSPAQQDRIIMAPGIECRRLPDSTCFDEVSFEAISDLANAEAGAQIAWRKVTKDSTFRAGQNVRIEIRDEQEFFCAAVRGKVLFFQNSLHVFPCDADCAVHIVVREDRMSALMDCKAGRGNGRPLTEEAAFAALREKGVVHGILRDAIRNALADCNDSHTSQKGIIVAQGTPPITGKNGCVQLNFDVENHGSEFRVLSDGRIDYKRSSMVQTARKGQRLAGLVDPGKGIPGLNVYGDSLPANEGVPARIVCGRGVSTPDGLSFFAEENGCILWNDPVLQIMDLYVVHGDVDMTTGSIDFNGSVLVNGGVREGFEIRAEGDIMVRQTAEACLLKAGLDIRVFGGVQGQGRGVLVAGHDIFAEYAQNATLEAQGKIAIKDFAVNSRLFASRFIQLLEKHGSIVGGEAHARRGMDVRVLGSSGGTRTYACAGLDFLVSRRLEEMEITLRNCEEAIRKIDNALKPVVELMRGNPAHLGSRRAIIERAVLKRKGLQQQYASFLEQKTRFERELAARTEPCFVKVSQICYPDVTVQIRGCKLRVSRQFQNVRFYEDIRNRVIKAGAY